MNHANMYAVGLALCTFADIASEEMSRDLANEIEKLLGSSNTYIRKKVYVLYGAALPDIFNTSLRRRHYVRFGLSEKYRILQIISSQKRRIYLRIATMVSY